MDEIAKELCKQKKNNRAYIKCAKIRKHTSYWPQKRFMYSRQGIDDHPDDWLPRIYNLECYKPTCCQICQQGPDVNINNLVNKHCERVHENLLILVLVSLLPIARGLLARHYTQN